ncbi:MAG: MarR family winged helix-turn-helix transcriptional regulator [Polyangiales bacterium]
MQEKAEISVKQAKPARRARENSFGWLVNMLGNRMDAQMREKLAVLGLDLPSFATLMTLFEGEGVTQTELSAAVGVQSYATTRTLDRMEKQKLVERRASPRSRRSYQIYLTTKGKALRGDLIAIVATVNKEILQHLELGQRKQLVTWLQQIELATRGD